jgi:DNA-binding transcriptional ArsR family regulator
MDCGMTAIVSTLKALADDTRFQIITLLLTHDLCVGALADHLNMSKAAISQHLQILRKAGLVRGEKRGYWTHYSVDKVAIDRIAQDLIKTTDQAPDSRAVCHRSIPDGINSKDIEGREFTMCKDCCQQPDRLKEKPGDCTPEQIKECHGDEKDHPCASKKEEK